MSGSPLGAADSLEIVEQTAVARARRHRDESGPQILAEIAEFFAIPNVASDASGVDRTAIWIRDALAGAGARAAVTQVPGAPPVVFGRIDGAPSGITFGVYAHFDGWPVDEDRWSSPPFLPTLRSGRIEDGAVLLDLPGAGDPIDPDWRLYARGSADGRAAVASLVTALGSRGSGTPLRSLVFLFEGEGEQGSGHLPEYLRLLAGRLRTDMWLICDGPGHPAGTPRVALGESGSQVQAVAAVLLEAAEAASGVAPIVESPPHDCRPLEHLRDVLGVPVAVVPIADPHDRRHGPDENLRIGTLWYGVDLMAALLG